MKTFRNHLNRALKDKEFAKIYAEERELVVIALKIHEARMRDGISQAQLAKRANVTQQQLSKVENGINCNMTTFLRVCNALKLRFNLV
jgi:HTH-type transcriptional regulator / antitoxin HipB